jgi:acyl-CoA reductase-like NAD-dependent aldehyde dehydrogenase
VTLSLIGRRLGGYRVLSSFFHQGQICLNTRRIIIQRKISEEFLGKFVARTSGLPAGDPLNSKTIIGPIITRDAVKLIDDRVKEAVSRGAKVHTGAKYDGQIYYPMPVSLLKSRRGSE